MTPMLHVQDRWQGAFSVFENAIYEYTIEAWGDFFRTWQHDFAAKFKAAQPDLASETLEGAGLLENAATLATSAGRKMDAKRLLGLAAEIRGSSPEAVNTISHRPELEALMTAWADRREACEFILNLPRPQELVEDGATQPDHAQSEAAGSEATEATTRTAQPHRRRWSGVRSRSRAAGTTLDAGARHRRVGVPDRVRPVGLPRR